MAIAAHWDSCFFVLLSAKTFFFTHKFSDLSIRLTKYPQ